MMLITESMQSIFHHTLRVTTQNSLSSARYSTHYLHLLLTK